MFIGEHRHTIDDKGRLSIPSKFRTLLQGDGNDTFFLTRGMDKFALLCTMEYWKVLEKGFTRHSLTNPAARAFKRAFYSGASALSFDKQGRIAIPQNLIDYAGLNKDVVIVGVSEVIEIWDAELWNSSIGEILENFGKAAQDLEETNTEK